MHIYVGLEGRFRQTCRQGIFRAWRPLPPGSPKRGTDDVRICCETRPRAPEEPHFCAFRSKFSLSSPLPAALAAHGQHESELSLLAAVNATRAAYGLRPLHLDSTLESAARSHSIGHAAARLLRPRQLRRADGRLPRPRPDRGREPRLGHGPYGRAGTIVQEWLASPEHRANLLRPGYARIGIGLARGSFLGTGGATVVTADFAGGSSRAVAGKAQHCARLSRSP